MRIYPPPILMTIQSFKSENAQSQYYQTNIINETLITKPKKNIVCNIFIIKMITWQR